MGHPQFETQAVRQLLEVVFEDVAVAGIAAATVAQQEHSTRVRIGGFPVRFPPVGDAVAGEATGVVAEAEIRTAEVLLEVVEAGG